MKKMMLMLFLAILGNTVFATDIYRPDLTRIKQSGVTLQSAKDGVVSVRFESPGEGKSCVYCPKLPPEVLAALNGKVVYLTAEINSEDVTQKPKPWHGVKLMLGMKFTNGKSLNPQATIPIGCSDDWTSYSVKLDLRDVTLTEGILVIGLENVGGIAEFRNIRITDTPLN